MLETEKLQYRLYFWILLDNNYMSLCSVAGRPCAAETSSQEDFRYCQVRKRYQPKGPGIVMARISESVNILGKSKENDVITVSAI